MMKEEELTLRLLIVATSGIVTELLKSNGDGGHVVLPVKKERQST